MTVKQSSWNLNIEVSNSIVRLVYNMYIQKTCLPQIHIGLKKLEDDITNRIKLELIDMVWETHTLGKSRYNKIIQYDRDVFKFYLVSTVMDYD